MLVATYLRVSTDEQVQHGTSLEAQGELCAERARRLGADAPVRFVDAGASGSDMGRPGLQSLLRAAERHEIDAVVCLDPDRLARNLAHQLIITDRLETLGVELHFVQFERARTPDGRLLYAIRGAIAEFEAHKIRERTIQGKRQRLREGRVVTGTRIYGYAYDRPRHCFVEDPAESAVVRAIFALAPHFGTPAIAQEMKDQGFRAKGGGDFSQSTIYGILRNPSYLGHMTQLRGQGRVKLPALVSPQEFEAAQAALDGRRKARAGSGRVYSLTGIAYCAACGRHVTGAGGSKAYYACTGKRLRPACQSPYHGAQELEAAVWAKVVSTIEGSSALERLRAEPPPHAQRQRVTRELRRIERQRQRLVQFAAHGTLAEHDLAEALAHLHAREKALRLADAAGAGIDHEALLRDLLAASDPQLRKRVLQALGVRVSIGEGRAEIRFAPTSDR